jgi:putative serine/threonine protein kinase
MLPIEKMTEEPYASILCYPVTDNAELRRRIKELRRLRIDAFEPVGEKHIFNVNVLGKGCVGIVVLAHRNRKRVALKIRRVDADRSRMQQEAKLLKRANSVHVGPKLLAATRNFLCMQYIEGVLLPEWLKKSDKAQIRRVLQEILTQCWRLDEINLDHGELSRAPKHVIVDERNRPVIVDFESASLTRKPANVTSMCQFLFIGSETAKETNRVLGLKHRKTVVKTLRRYKNERSPENFRSVLSVLGLHTT